MHAFDKSNLVLLTSRLQQERDKIIAEHPAFGCLAATSFCRTMLLSKFARRQIYFVEVTSQKIVYDRRLEIGYAMRK